MLDAASVTRLQMAMATDEYTTWVLGGGLLLAYAVATIIRKSSRKTDENGKELKHPPGTLGWPIVGHLPYLDPANPYKPMNYYMGKFGKLFRMQWGSWNAVVVTDYHLIKKLYNDATYTFRPGLFLFKIFTQNYHGLALSNGHLWMDQRRFALKQLKDLGVGKSSIENHVHLEIDKFCEVLRSTKGESLDPDMHINFATTNIIWAILTRKRLEYNDPKFEDFVKKFKEAIEIGIKFNLVAFVNWVHHVFPTWLLGTTAVHATLRELQTYTHGIIEEHRKTFDPNDPRDYIDYFFIEQEKQRNDPNSTFTDLQLSASLVDFFVAGGETVATTLRWAFLLLGMHPAVQKKMQEELDQVVGRERVPYSTDKENLPYISAVINEIQRFADISTYGLFHGNDKDAVFEGYHIPKDTIITAYFGNMHRSAEFWERPYQFYPEHFLTPDGKLRENVDGFLPFSIGKRKCVGVNLARVELFNFITKVLHEFDIKMDNSIPLPSLDADPKSSLLRWPHPYRVSFVPRTN